VDPLTRNSYSWIDNGPLFQPNVVFYNFPYAFDLLFALGLYARYRADPEAFRSGYDDLLSRAGPADPATLAMRLGIDIRTPTFWRERLAIINSDIDRLERLLGLG
jgi:oligoendopeptidase F